MQAQTIWVQLLLAFTILSGCPALIAAQEVEAASETLQDQDNTLLAQYELKKAELKATNRKLNQAYANLSINSRDDQNAQLTNIQALKAQANQLQLEVFQAAFEAVRGTGEINRNVMRDAIEYAKESFDGNKYNFPVAPSITLEICDAMKARGVPARNLLQLTVKASLSTLDFERAKRAINSAADDGMKVSDQMIELVKSSESKWQREETLRAEESDLPTIRIQTTVGDITIALFEDAAPQGVRNIVNLIDSEFFNGLKFFAAARGQNLRSGCPDNTGRGSAEYFITNEAKLETARHHFRGSLSMMAVNNGEWCSSQFLLTQRPLPHLDGAFTVVGRIVDGMEIMDQLVEAVLDADGKLEDKPSIELIEVLYRRRDTTYTPDKLKEK